MTLEAFKQRVEQAAASAVPLRLRGGGSKDFYGNAPKGELLDLSPYRGVVAYEPTELVLTARAGTPLAELEALLEAANQMLAFEPPHFGPRATLGGCVAAGLSGPRRAAAGALRDFVLGVRMLDGRGRELSFGGQVMKNVAGYDVSRLLAGSLGTLGVILEVSLKVLPRPAAEATLRLELPEDKAIETANRWAGMPLPISATAWSDGALSVRLSGARSAVLSAAGKLGGERLAQAEADGFWRGIREHGDSFFRDAAPLWRLSLPSNARRVELPGAQLVEWNGALRWLKSSADPGAIRDAAARAGGHATLFRAADKSVNAFAPLAPATARLHRELKTAFDPAGILNPGRLYPEF